ncbi:hypothetical protein AX16_000554 [Volvariella volvacea WC 439]|nr:hypothetical protein AX16_000554 [Volvariella volvacea WC 439]
MAGDPKGLLFAYADPGTTIGETAFNDWYDNEHAPARIALSEIYTALRYKANDSKNPEWLALYDLKSPSTLEGSEYRQVQINASDNERYILREIELLQRRIYKQVSEWTLESVGKSATGPSSEVPGKYLLITAYDVEDSEEARKALKDFRENESVESVAKVPGWVRGRRYELVDSVDLGQNTVGPERVGGKKESPVPVKFLSIHEFDQPGYAESEEMKAVTVRAEKLRGFVKDYEVRSFELYRDFAKR